MSRAKVYRLVTAWTSPLLFILLAIQLLTGLGAIKGRELSAVTLGLLDPASSGKLHTVWLVLVSGILVYLHAVCGLGVLISRSRLIRHKLAWEIVLYLVGGALFAQFMVLYFL